MAAFWVALYHFCLMAGLSPPASIGLPAVLLHGYLAVDIFFVLSGFVMALSYGHFFKNGFSPNRFGIFLMRRMARVYPLYIAITALTVALLMRHSGVVPFLRGRGTELLANVVMVQSWGFSRSIVVAAWSVSVEAIAYVLFPILSAIFLYSSAKIASAGAIVCAVGLIGIGLVSIYGGARAPTGIMDIHQDYSFYPVVRCLCGFGLGLCTYRYATRPAARTASTTATLIRVGAALLPLTLLLPGFDLVTVLLIPCLILFLLEDNVVARVMQGRFMIFLGEISYAVYLVHGDVMEMAKLMLHSHLAQRAGFPLALTVCLVFWVVMTTAAAYAVHKLLEVPARGWIRHFEFVFDAGAGRKLIDSRVKGREDIAGSQH